jgi:transcriptional regulator with XRE-family HTH domain
MVSTRGLLNWPAALPVAYLKNLPPRSTLPSRHWAKAWTQEELGKHSELSYKFIGEIERGQQNPSFDTFIKIAAALNVDLPELFRFEQIATDKKTAEDRLYKIIKAMTDEDIRRLYAILNVLYPAS